MKLSSLKVTMIVVAILLFILGCVIVLNPFSTALVMTYLFIIALGVGGICSIIKFAVDSDRSAWDLVVGILELVVCITLLSNENLVESTLITQAAIGYILSVILIVRGIGFFITAYNVHKLGTGRSIAGFVFSGILAILVAICFICVPIFTTTFSVYIAGIFTVIMAVIMFVNGVSIDTSADKK